jgi:hypothetical protein
MAASRNSNRRVEIGSASVTAGGPLQFCNAVEKNWENVTFIRALAKLLT